MKKIISSLLILLNISLPVFAITDKLSVTSNQSPLNSDLKKKYSAYEYTIVNNSPVQINVVNAQIVNGVDGNVAYNVAEQSVGSAVGVTWAIAGPIGLFTLGLGWIVGLIATPIVWVVYKNKDDKTRTESIAYTNMVPLGYISSGENVTVKTLVPVGSRPQLKLTIQDEKTKQLHSLVKN